MTNHEAHPGFEKDPAREAMLRFCDNFKHVLNLAEQLKQEYSEELERTATTGAVSLYHQSFNAGLPYPFKIIVGKNIEAHSSENLQPIEEGLSSFTTTDLREVTVDKVVFFNFPHGPWHVVFGHDMRIEPVFPGEESA